ncbi:MAG: Rpn family recombination-promoting nuclease/putative transposase [Synergistaceae bacterium]|jgi:predicted transposase/invertase (TIGR01784 family)|nr:Rpn family recombination-promoting nuclease/putative transposase [Synergistaceae bacterium]
MDSELKKAKDGLNRLNDRLFKYIFASEQHKENLIRFLNDVLNDPARIIVDIEYLDRELDPPFFNGKLVHFDVRAKSVDGRIFHVEVQIAEENDIIERCLFYTCNNYISQLAISQSYEKLNEVVFVGVLNFNMFPDKPDSFHSVHKLLDTDNHRCYCRGIEMHFLELPKLKKQGKDRKPEKLTGLERMLTYIGTKGVTESLSRIAAYDSDIDRILHLEEMFMNEREQWVGYLMRERAQTDWEHYLKTSLEKATAEGMAQGMAEGKAKGKAEGIAEGEAKSKAEAAIKMLRLGMDKNTISQVTELSPAEIQKLAKTENPVKRNTGRKRA